MGDCEMVVWCASAQDLEDATPGLLEGGG